MFDGCEQIAHTSHRPTLRKIVAKSHIENEIGSFVMNRCSELTINIHIVICFQFTVRRIQSALGERISIDKRIEADTSKNTGPS